MSVTLIDKKDINDLLDKIFYVGCIYTPMEDKNPADILGFGIWEKIEGKFLLGANKEYEAGSTGGEATHKLTIDEMPEHLHEISSSLQWSNQEGNVAGGNNTYYQRSESQTTQLAGGGEPHNNMPPYVAVYMWRRTE